MREKIISTLLVVLIIFFIPVFITTILSGIRKKDENTDDIKITINYNQGENKIDLEDYIIGVVAAEMPVTFHEEALKAQAVAARTYTLKKLEEDDSIIFTSDFQSYYSEEELESIWGVNDYALYYSKLQNAVSSTKGMVMIYDHDLIDAVFHSTSTGMTQSAEEMWGQDIPYLKGVESLEDINAPTYLHRYSYSNDEFIKIMEQYDDELVINDNISSQIQIIERNSVGYIKKIQIGNKIYEGQEFRNIFGLASSNFQITLKDNNTEILCKGYGHGVGLSQYGADAMAKAGHSFADILKHYYKDIKITK